jgi:hypothetical protein
MSTARAAHCQHQGAAYPSVRAGLQTVRALAYQLHVYRAHLPRHCMYILSLLELAFGLLLMWSLPIIALPFANG